MSVALIVLSVAPKAKRLLWNLFFLYVASHVCEDVHNFAVSAGMKGILMTKNMIMLWQVQLIQYAVMQKANFQDNVWLRSAILLVTLQWQTTG